MTATQDSIVMLLWEACEPDEDYYLCDHCFNSVMDCVEDLKS